MHAAEFLTYILALMAEDEICIIGNTMNVPATEAAALLSAQCPDTIVIVGCKDSSILVYRKNCEIKYRDAIKQLCE